MAAKHLRDHHKLDDFVIAEHPHYKDFGIFRCSVRDNWYIRRCRQENERLSEEDTRASPMRISPPQSDGPDISVDLTADDADLDGVIQDLAQAFHDPPPSMNDMDVEDEIEMKYNPNVVQVNGDVSVAGRQVQWRFKPVAPDRRGVGTMVDGVFVLDEDIDAALPAVTQTEQLQRPQVPVRGRLPDGLESMQARPVQTTKYVTGNVRRKFVAKATEIATKLVAAFESDNTEAINEQVMDLMMLPALILQCGKSHSRRPQRGEPVEGNRDDAAAAQVPGLLPDEDESDAADLQASIAAVRTANRVNYLCSRNLFGKAMEVLMQKPLAPMDDATVDQMCELVAEPTEAVDPSYELGEGVQVLDISDQELLSVMKRGARGAAPDIHRWTGELMITLLDHPVCARAAKLVIMMIANNDPRFSDLVRTRLKASMLIAIAKKTGGVRPIVLVSAWVKAAERLLNGRISPTELETIFKGIQFGPGAVGGAERAAIVLQNMVEVSVQRQEEMILINCDFKNAFNRALREFIARGIKQYGLRKMINMFLFCYSDPSLLMMYDDEQLVARLLSKLGVHQGSSMGGLGFCLGLQTILDQVAAAYPMVKFVAVFDDVNLHGPTQEAFDAFCMLRDLAAKDNLVLNPTKTKVLVCRPDGVGASEELIGLCAAHGLSEPKKSIVTLGLCIGLDDAATTALIDDKVSEIIEQFIPAVMNPGIRSQFKYLLLKHCCLTKVNYLTRCCRPDLTTNALRRLDVKMIEALGLALGIDVDEVSPVVRSQMHLPVKSGGLGFRLTEATTDVAFFSARSEAARSIAEFARGPDIEPTPMDDAWERSHANLRECGVVHTVDDKTYGQIFTEHGDHATLQRFYTRKKVPHLQHRLQLQLDASLERGLKLEFRSSRRDLARLRAAAQPGARVPVLRPTIHCTSDRTCRLDLLDQEYQMMLRLRFGLTPVQGKFMPNVCACNRKLDGEAFDHLLTCEIASVAGRTRAHNLIRDAVLKCAADVGCQVEKEKRFAGFDTVPDGMVIDHLGRVTIFDVSCAQPTATTYYRRAARVDLSAANARVAIKQRKFEHLARQINASLVPFVLERSGGFSKPARDFMMELGRLGELSSTHESGGEASPQHRVWARITKALHQGNVLLVKTALQKCCEFRLSRVYQYSDSSVGAAV
jgi:hypothetical protein